MASDLENKILYFKYRNLEDLLKIMIYALQSPIGLLPMFYYTFYENKHIFFIQTGSQNSITLHYISKDDKPEEKFIQLNKFTGEFTFTKIIGDNALSIYIPIIETTNTHFKFPK